VRRAASQQAHAQGPRNFATLAMVAEPQTLDPMASTADLVGTIMQHVYETLYTFDAKWNVVPMLAETMPKISADGKTYAITLRKGVMLHNGRELTADDVVASLQRWMDQSPRGKAVGKEIESLKAKGPLGIDIVLKEPYAPLLSQLALPSGMAAIMAKDSIASPLKDFVGTGPYKFKERRPDQFVLLTRFDKYSARKEPASGYGGKREAAIEELRFVPVPNASTRVEGALAGQYDFADLLPVEALPRLEKSGGKTVPIMTPSFGFPYLVLNTKEGVAANQAVRQAIQSALGEGEMLAAGFGDTRFFTAEGNHFPKGSPFYSTAGVTLYNERNARQGQGSRGQGRLQGRAHPRAHQPPVRLPLQHGAADGRAAEARRLQGRPERGRLGHAGAAPQRLQAVGHLRHAFGPVPRADALAAATGRRRARLVGFARQEVGAAGLQCRERPGQARRAVGQGAAGGV
jgi:peptide/nickel transport system substrate-binding protein